MLMVKKLTLILGMICIFIFLSGCVRPLQADPLESDVPAFVPPTLIPATPTTEIIEPTSQNVNMTQTVACIDNLTFIQDETIPDGTVVPPGEMFEKKWEVKNSGTCNWGPGYSIRLIGGPSLEAPSPQDLFPARSGTSLSLRIEFFAPTEAGKYRSAWQAYNPNEIAFGDSFYVDFIVEE
jgi:hypothetical protein